MAVGIFKRWMKRIALVLAALLLVAFVFIQLSFRTWRHHQRDQISNGSTLLELEQGTLEYATVGEGPAILYMHGAPGGYDLSTPVQGFRTITPSRPGYLRTDLSIGPTYQAAASAYAALLDSLAIEQVAIVGISAGGPSALQFAMQYPERVWALVLISAITKERILPIPERSMFERVTDILFGQDFADWVQLKALQQFPEALLLEGENEMLSPDDQKILRTNPKKLQQLQELFSNYLGVGSRRLEGYINDRVQYAKISEPDPLPITAPTLVVHGTADSDVVYDYAESAARRIGGAQLVPIEGAGHLAVWVRDEIVMPLIADFLKEKYSASFEE